MALAKIKPANIEEYIQAAPADVQEKLRELHACIIEAAPGAKESLKWGMPAYSYARILVTFAVYKNHIGFYPTPSALMAFSKDLSKFKTAAASVQFPLDKPLPLALIRKMTKFRIQESLGSDIKWRS